MKAAVAALTLCSCSIATLVAPPRDPQGRKQCWITPVIVDGAIAVGAGGAGATVRFDAKSSTDRAVGDWMMIAALPFAVSAAIGYIVESNCKPPPDEP